MSKIVRAANAMIMNSGKIDSVIENSHREKDLYFLYDQKHKWSVWMDSDDGEYWLYYYPGGENINDIASGAPSVAVSYSTKKMNDRESIQTFAELFRVIEEKYYGLDKVLNEIIDQG